MKYNKIFVVFLIILSIFITTGCQKKISDEEKVSKAITVMKNDVEKYLLTTNINYSDEEKTINGTFYSNINVKNKENYFNGKVNFNGSLLEMNGMFDDSKIIIANNEEINKINLKLKHIKDFNFSNIEYIENRDGDKNLDYYKVKIDNKYQGRIGIGKKDNIIYTVYIDLNKKQQKKLVAINEINLTISDTEKEIKKITNKNYTKEIDNFLDLFTTTEEGGGIDYE